MNVSPDRKHLVSLLGNISLPLLAITKATADELRLTITNAHFDLIEDVHIKVELLSEL